MNYSHIQRHTHLITVLTVSVCGYIFLKYTVSNAGILSVSQKTRLHMVCVVASTAVQLKAILEENFEALYSILFCHVYIYFPWGKNVSWCKNKNWCFFVFFFFRAQTWVLMGKPGFCGFSDLHSDPEQSRGRTRRFFLMAFSQVLLCRCVCATVCVCICWGSRSVYQWPAHSPSWWCMEESELQ